MLYFLLLFFLAVGTTEVLGSFFKDGEKAKACPERSRRVKTQRSNVKSIGIRARRGARVCKDLKV